MPLELKVTGSSVYGLFFIVFLSKVYVIQHPANYLWLASEGHPLWS